MAQTFASLQAYWDAHPNPKRGVFSIMVGRNTYLKRRSENEFAIRLYQTDVVLVHRDGSYTLNSGGNRTDTTRDRIEKFAPVAIDCINGEWIVSPSPWITHETWKFEDPIVVEHNGIPAHAFGLRQDATQ